MAGGQAADGGRSSEPRRPTQQAMRVKRIICQYVRSFRICTAFAGSCQLPVAHCHHHWAEIGWNGPGLRVLPSGSCLRAFRSRREEEQPPSYSSSAAPECFPEFPAPTPVLEFFVRLCRLFNCSLSQRNPGPNSHISHFPRPSISHFQPVFSWLLPPFG